MDGVLIDSREAVIASYAEAGVDMPHDAWGRPWEEWLPAYFGGDMDRARAAHRLKASIYDRMPLKLLSGAEVLRRSIARGATVGVLTGASMSATARVMRELGVHRDLSFFASGLTTEMKNRWILSGYNGRTVYIDDDLDKGVLVVAGADNTRLVHYHGQTADELMEDVWTP